jgi:hypothetical protein
LLSPDLRDDAACLDYLDWLRLPSQQEAALVERAFSRRGESKLDRQPSTPAKS